MNNPSTNYRFIAIVANTRAGKGKSLKLLADIVSALQQRTIQHIVYTDHYPPAFEACSEVWIVGGDGTLNYFLNKYSNIDIPLAIFKGGSGNDFAWKLYGDISFEQQLQIALNGNAKPVDAGTCNGHLFINGVGIGFDGEVVKSMGAKRFISSGHIAYLVVVLKKILFYREKDLTIKSDSKQSRSKLFMISIANGSRYGGGFMIAPQAIVDDGVFDIVIIKPVAALKRFFYLPRIEKGKHLALNFVEVSKTKKILITSLTPVAAHFDGELLEDKTYDIRILPGRFRFLY